jgi:DNA-binding response OmpR family regulator
LIVEDEFLVRLTLAEALADEGFDVIEAETADEAIDLLQADDGIQLLLTDIQLPGRLNGHELARRARQSVPGLPIIFMTGRPEAMGTRDGSPRDVFIAKPYLPSEVCAVARRLTGSGGGTSQAPC